MVLNKESSLGRFSNEQLAEMFDYAEDHGGYSRGFPHSQIGEELNRRKSLEERVEPIGEIRFRQRQVDHSAGMRGIGRGRSNR